MDDSRLAIDQSKINQLKKWWADRGFVMNGDLAGPDGPRGPAGPEGAEGPPLVSSVIKSYFKKTGKVRLPGVKNKVLIYPGYTEFKNDIRQMPKPDEEKSKRGKITFFSARSRRDMQKRLGQLSVPPSYWVDFTFEDSTMQGMTKGERAKRSTYTLKKFNQMCKVRGIVIEGVWKREWKFRKSGVLQGQLLPHFHIFFNAYRNGARITLGEVTGEIMLLWVKATGVKYGTEAHMNALKVAYNPKSFREINSYAEANKYATKYISDNEKEDVDSTPESIGRCWGMLGNPAIADPEVIEVGYEGMVRLRRIVRKRCNKTAKGWFKKALRDEYGEFFIFISHNTMKRLLEWLNEENQVIEGVPF
jgi:hypothetical protein